MKAMFFISKRIACLNTQYVLYKWLDVDLTLLKTRNCVLKAACKTVNGKIQIFASFYMGCNTEN